MSAHPATLERRCAIAAAALAAGQIAVAIAGAGGSWLVALPAIAVVGLALVPWLPRELRAARLALAALVLPIGAVALDVAMVGAGGVELPFTAPTACVVLTLFAVAGVLGARRVEPAPRSEPVAPAEWLAAAGAVGVAVGLALLVNHGLPPAGNDWAKYLLYADEIRDHHHTLIDNDFWLLGQPFREDPGVPALHATFLVISGGGAGALGWGIVLLVGLVALAIAGALVQLFGARAGVIGALVFAVAPATADMSAWHGAANMLGLVAVAICLVAAGMLLRGGCDARWTWLLALGLVGVACAHRLSSLIAFATLGLVAAAALARAPRPTARVLRRVALGLLAIGALPAVDLYRRSRDGGGVLDYHHYLTTKVDWSLVARDLTWPALTLAALALAVVLARRRRDPVVWLALALGAVTVAYAYAWVLHVPGFYARATYFMPITLALLVAAAAAALPPRAVLVATVPALVLAAVSAAGTADDAGAFYRFVDRPALRGFDVLAARIGPRDVVVTDRCTSFTTTWLVKAPTLAAMRDDEIGPAAELPRVREARAIVRGGRTGRRLARLRRARWLVVNPDCPGRPIVPPAYAAPVYISTHLVVFALSP